MISGTAHMSLAQLGRLSRNSTINVLQLKFRIDHLNHLNEMPPVILCKEHPIVLVDMSHWQANRLGLAA